MKRLIACLALCASLSASAQDDNCTVLGIQDLTQMVFEFQGQLNAQDATIDSLQNAAMTRDSVRAIARGEVATGGSFGHADLSGANLEGTDLSGANLEGADLSGANLEGTDLSGANFEGADLSGADLSGANLEGADLSGADLSDADLYGANLSDADLSDANLFNADLSGANLSGADLTGASLVYADLSFASLTCLQGCPSHLPGGYFCTLDPCDFIQGLGIRFRIIH